jgi:hypothetical protein
MAAAFGSGKDRKGGFVNSLGSSVDFITAAEVATFKQAEGWASGQICEMPVHVSDIFRA